MKQPNIDSVDILETLCRIPTVSYYERGIATAIWRFCERFDLHVASDHWGNLFASGSGVPPSEARVAFVAHMDHPGFEVVERNADGTYRAVSHGGVARVAFVPGMHVRVPLPDGGGINGLITACDDIQERGRFASSNSITLELEEPIDELPCMALVPVPDFVYDGGWYRGRALDDLAGCATILSALIDSKDSNQPVLGIFTRAEEVGLVGARLIAANRVLNPECVVVSVETSLKSDAARQGDGVVIRVGDRMTTFDDFAESLLRPYSGYVQRALMSAGGCEASAFAAHGYRVTGTSLPLGAWHNMEDDGSLSMEYVSGLDFEAGVELVTEVMRSDLEELMRESSRPLAAHPDTESARLVVDGDDWPLGSDCESGDD